jgi:hypothetical protein
VVRVRDRDGVGVGVGVGVCLAQRHLGRRWERSLSTRVLSVTACACCASARHLIISVNSRRRGAEPLLHGEQQRGHRVDRRLSRLPQVYAASMLAVSPRACGARYTATKQEHGLSVRDGYWRRALGHLVICISIASREQFRQVCWEGSKSVHVVRRFLTDKIR